MIKPKRTQPDFERDWPDLSRTLDRLAEAERVQQRVIHEPLAAGDFQDWQSGPQSYSKMPEDVRERFLQHQRVKRRKEVRNDIIIVVAFVVVLVSIAWVITHL